MRYASRFTCTPDMAQHTLRGLADYIEEQEAFGLRLVDIQTEKLESKMLQIFLIFENNLEIKMENLI